MRDKLFALVLLSVFASAGAALAERTEVHPPYYAQEHGHRQILEDVYGVTLLADGDDFVADDASLRISRMDDETGGDALLDAVMGIVGSAADTVWSSGLIQATARARYAAYSQQFGYDAGDGFEVLFNVEGTGTNVSGTGEVDLLADTWVWGRRNTDGNKAWYSEPSRNSDGLDHLVTYRIEGLDTPDTVWMLMWEDLPGSYAPPGGSDRDFNDLVVEVRAIPEPATVAMLALGVPLARLRRRG